MFNLYLDMYSRAKYNDYQMCTQKQEISRSSIRLDSHVQLIDDVTDECLKCTLVSTGSQIMTCKVKEIPSFS